MQIKLGNIFLTSRQELKLGDFGIVRELEGTGTMKSMADTVIGTPYNMSPEIMDSKPYSYKSDIWSLGCVLYELAMLKHAFEGKSLGQLVLKIMQGKYIPVDCSRYSPSLGQLVDSMLRVEPDERPSVADIINMPYIQRIVRAFRSTASATAKAQLSAASARLVAAHSGTSPQDEPVHAAGTKHARPGPAAPPVEPTRSRAGSSASSQRVDAAPRTRVPGQGSFSSVYKASIVHLPSPSASPMPSGPSALGFARPERRGAPLQPTPERQDSGLLSDMSTGTGSLIPPGGFSSYSRSGVGGTSSRSTSLYSQPSRATPAPSSSALIPPPAILNDHSSSLDEAAIMAHMDHALAKQGAGPSSVSSRGSSHSETAELMAMARAAEPVHSPDAESWHPDTTHMGTVADAMAVISAHAAAEQNQLEADTMRTLVEEVVSPLARTSRTPSTHKTRFSSPHSSPLQGSSTPSTNLSTALSALPSASLEDSGFPDTHSPAGAVQWRHNSLTSPEVVEPEHSQAAPPHRRGAPPALQVHHSALVPPSSSSTSTCSSSSDSSDEGSVQHLYPQRVAMIGTPAASAAHSGTTSGTDAVVGFDSASDTAALSPEALAATPTGRAPAVRPPPPQQELLPRQRAISREVLNLSPEPETSQSPAALPTARPSLKHAASAPSPSLPAAPAASFPPASQPIPQGSASVPRSRSQSVAMGESGSVRGRRRLVLPLSKLPTLPDSASEEERKQHEARLHALSLAGGARARGQSAPTGLPPKAPMQRQLASRELGIVAPGCGEASSDLDTVVEVDSDSSADARRSSSGIARLSSQLASARGMLQGMARLSEGSTGEFSGVRSRSGHTPSSARELLSSSRRRAATTASGSNVERMVLHYDALASRSARWAQNSPAMRALEDVSRRSVGSVDGSVQEHPAMRRVASMDMSAVRAAPPQQLQPARQPSLSSSQARASIAATLRNLVTSLAAYRKTKGLTPGAGTPSSGQAGSSLSKSDGSEELTPHAHSHHISFDDAIANMAARAATSNSEPGSAAPASSTALPPAEQAPAALDDASSRRSVQLHRQEASSVNTEHSVEEYDAALADAQQRMDVAEGRMTELASLDLLEVALSSGAPDSPQASPHLPMRVRTNRLASLRGTRGADGRRGVSGTRLLRRATVQ